MARRLAQGRKAGVACAAARGFTLIEILVVVVILGVLAAALVLSTAGSGQRRLEREAEQTRALIAFACEQAELRGREIGVSVSEGGYRFSQLDGDTWSEIRDGELRPRKWLEGTSTALSRDGQRIEVATQFPIKPQLLCFSSGELTPFQLDLALGEVVQRFRLDGDPTGAVALTAVQANAH